MHRPLPSTYAVSTTVLMAASMLLWSVSGCTDHRMTLDEYQQIEQQYSQVAASDLPDTSATTSEDVSRILDETFGQYRVVSGDVLTFIATPSDPNTQSFSVQARVNSQGYVRLPLVEPIQINDMSLEEVEEAVRRAYVPKIFRQLSVLAQVVDPQSTRVLVIGAVSAPGLIELNANERNLLFALVRSGGVTNNASGLATLKRIRQPGDEVVVNLKDPQGLTDALTMAPLQNGDIINVHAAMPNTIFIGGLVNAPRTQTYPAGVEMTLLQAIVGAGGLRQDVTPREATLIRRMPDGTDAHVRLDLDRIASGQDPNITLSPGDILWVPHTAETRVQDWINRNVFFRAGMSFTYNLEGDEDYLHGDSGYDPSLLDRFDPLGNLLRSSTLVP